MKEQPKLMDASRMRGIFESHLAQYRENCYFDNEIGILYGDLNIFHLMIQQKPPFAINDHRFGIITEGEADINFNLQDRHIKAGTMVYLGPGTIINPIRISDDMKIYGLVLFADFALPFASGQLPSAFNGQVRDFELQASEYEVQLTHQIINVLWQLVHQENYHRPTVSALVAALMHHYDQLFSRQADLQAARRSREQTIFDRFIQLVSQHCHKEHQINYYAERMCLTNRYLGTVIRQTSGVTAKEWIDRALVTYAKTQLLHTDKSVAEIAFELNFPNPSFFSKFFKHATGMPPLTFAQTRNKSSIGTPPPLPTAQADE